MTGVGRATPLYTVREGRTCDNCHALPNDWVNPPETAWRKCTLGCSGCHVDPGGGGLRTVSGVYFGQSTLPMWMAEDRPWADKKSHGEYVEVPASGSQPTGDASSRPSSQPSGDATSQPSSQPSADASSQPSSQPSAEPPRPTGGLAFGLPFDGGGSRMAFLDGRYGRLSADPFLRLGADLRMGAWNQGAKVFPMQGDVYAAAHPIEHLTLDLAGGIRGRIRGPFRDDRDGQSRLGVRDVWLMTHEWPFNAYARVGRFLPEFGWRQDDHTAYTRRPFGLSQEDPANRVIGAELGFNANYPYANVTAWIPGTRRPDNPLEPADGWGASANAGYRELGWQLGVSGMLRHRPLSGGGDTADASVQWGFNPRFWLPEVPLAYLGETVYGHYQRLRSGKTTSQVSTFHDLSYNPTNGITLHGRFETWDPDREVKEDDIKRAGVGVEFIPVPMLTVRLDIRKAFTPIGGGGGDAFLQLHGWF